MELELELRNHAEVAAAAARAPIELRILASAGMHDLAVGRDDVDRLQVVDRHAELARNAAKATAKGQAAHTRVRHRPEWRHQLMRRRFLVYLSEQRASGGPNTAG